MIISILTLFPEILNSPFGFSIVKRAQEKKLLKINLINIRDFGLGKYKAVDDRPYGGGEGMILRVDVLAPAIESVSMPRKKERIILLDPKGKIFNQKTARRLLRFEHLILICGHYEGIDERVNKFVDETISIGEYVLTGGEIPAAVIVDCLTRLIPRVLSKKEAVACESFSSLATTMEFPQYTRPPQYQGLKVPSVLLSGNHQKITSFRKKEAQKLDQRRAKLLKNINLPG
jgi:tRNA (guanine37-N1)-methyltransferase